MASSYSGNALSGTEGGEDHCQTRPATITSKAAMMPFLFIDSLLPVSPLRCAAHQPAASSLPGNTGRSLSAISRRLRSVSDQSMQASVTETPY